MLFDEIVLRDMTLKNRIVMAPMCMYSAGGDAAATDWHRMHYAARAIGGAGLIVQEATAVSGEGRISSRDLGIYEDAHVAGLKSIVGAVHGMGAKIGIQLAHAGRKCEADVPKIYAPSAIAFDEKSREPVSADAAYIEKTVADFRAAAARALEAGYDIVQIHAAHGYLVNEFLSPVTNRRTDSYGGAPENRVRILGEIIDAVRSVWPESKPLSVRVTAEDYEPDGNHPEDIAAMLNLVKDRGMDCVNVSSGGVTPTAPKAFPGYQIPYAEIIRRETGLPVCAGGLVTEAAMAEEAVSHGRCDAVYLGRELLRNPFFPLLASVELGADIPWPAQYERAKPRR
ncbi:MAG: NADPH dehydrogenase NamA [Clostridiales Family XIII bacterium]|nr:NADPH dehydrogenase NamA [Clostridiales Family XIII bacterium]